MATLGSYPTPVRLLSRLSSATSALWVKHDDRTNATYGGNKVRKLERVLPEVCRLDKRTVVTLGAVGSHHVLATGIFGKACGLAVEAVVFRQPRSEHVLMNARASVGQGVRMLPAGSYAEAAFILGARVALGSYLIPAGGSSQLGTLGYVEAALELAQQIAAGAMPEPDVIVVALGSGGTAAGLAAGVLRAGLGARVLGVTVAQPARLLERNARLLVEHGVERGSRREALVRLECTRAYLGPGYGRVTPEATQAQRAADAEDLALDETYTAKAFAAALDCVRAGRDRTILFWHTLSSAAMAPLLATSPREHELDPQLLRLACEP